MMDPRLRGDDNVDCGDDNVDCGDDNRGLRSDGAAEGGKDKRFAFAHAIKGKQSFVVNESVAKTAQLKLFIDAAAEHGKSGIVLGREMVHSIHILPLFLGNAQTHKRSL